MTEITAKNKLSIKWASILAMGENRCIGNKGTLPWHLPEDLQFFKKTTLNHPIIMGGNTFRSLGKVLPNRPHFVLTESPNLLTYHYENKANEKVRCFSNLEKLKLAVEEEFLEGQFSNNTAFVIGGASLYKLFWEQISDLYLTQIHQSFEGDTFLPNPLRFSKFKILEKSEEKVSQKSTPMGLRFSHFHYTIDNDAE